MDCWQFSTRKSKEFSFLFIFFKYTPFTFLLLATKVAKYTEEALKQQISFLNKASSRFCQAFCCFHPLSTFVFYPFKFKCLRESQTAKYCSGSNNCSLEKSDLSSSDKIGFLEAPTIVFTIAINNSLLFHLSPDLI